MLLFISSTIRIIKHNKSVARWWVEYRTRKACWRFGRRFIINVSNVVNGREIVPLVVVHLFRDFLIVGWLIIRPRSSRHKSSNFPADIHWGSASAFHWGILCLSPLGGGQLERSEAVTCCDRLLGRQHHMVSGDGEYNLAATVR